MKLLKSVPSMLLTFLLALLLSVPALALEDEQPEEPESASPAVCTLDELLAAIESAENGDTIILQSKISITGNCIIGQSEKRITICSAENFSGDIMFEVFPYEGQDITLQNIVLDGQNKSTLTAIEANFYGTPDSKGTISLTDIQVINFISGHSNIYFNAVDVAISNCQFSNNTAKRTAGIEIASNATAKISDCTFSDNESLGNGGALSCRGQVQIERSIIEHNRAFDPDSARMGGGIYIDRQASCEILDCKIVDNISFLGGGISAIGELSIIDTVLCKNEGLKGASDIRVASTAKLSMTYSDGIKSIYPENDPIGFYLDNMDNRFNAEINAVFLGESLTEDTFDYGAKFIFADELPKESPEEPPKEPSNPNESEPPVELPIEPQKPDTPNTDTPQEPDVPSDNDLPPIPVAPIEPDTSEPTRPVVPNEPDEDIILPSMPIKPSRPSTKEPPVVQEEPSPTEEEPPKLELSHGGLILDSAIPLVLLGYGDGQLHENDPITRAQIVVLLYRSLTDDSKFTIASESHFADVANGAWYYDAVTVLASAGIINGCDGLFHPNDTLTLGQLIAILTRFVAPKEAPMPDGLSYVEHWSYENIVTAVAYGWIDNAEGIEPDRPITRGETVKFVNLIFDRL